MFEKLLVIEPQFLRLEALDWSGIQALTKELIMDEVNAKTALENHLHEIDAILLNKYRISEEEILRAKKLRYIGITATGYDGINLELTKSLGITVTNAPNYSTFFVAQTVFAHLLEHMQSVRLHDNSVKQNEWSYKKMFSYWKFPLGELCGLTLGIIGLGNIGIQVAKIAHTFGMNVLATTPSGTSKGAPVSIVTQEALLRESDVVSLHCPHNQETENMVNADFLKAMKPTALLINVARGPLVDEKALFEALSEGVIRGAAIDVMVKEPPPPDHPFFTCRNITITPHHAWASVKSRQTLIDICQKNIEAYFQNKPLNKLS